MIELDPHFRDALTEFVGLGIGKAGEVLNAMLDSHIDLSAPSVRIIASENLAEVLTHGSQAKLSSVEMRYSGSIDGTVKLIFQSIDAGKLVDSIIGENSIQEEGLDAIRAGTLCEIGNVVINAMLGTISNQLNLSLSYTVPFYRENTAAELISDDLFQSGKIILLIESRFVVEDLEVAGNIAMYLSIISFGTLKESIERYIGTPS